MPALTLTLELPDALAERFSPLPESARREYALSLLRAGAAAEDALTPSPPIDYAAESAALDAAFAAIREGKERPAADVFADLFARHGVK